jgi:hypothetical protein
MLVSVSAVVPRLDPGVPAGLAWEGEVASLLARSAAVPDPRSPQGLRIQRRRRKLGAKRWSTETVYPITDLTAEQATIEELATWARGHATVENIVHWVRDMTFGEDAGHVRTRNTPAALASIRDLIRGALHLAGHANIASGRRAHPNLDQALTLHQIE